MEHSEALQHLEKALSACEATLTETQGMVKMEPDEQFTQQQDVKPYSISMVPSSNCNPSSPFPPIEGEQCYLSRLFRRRYLTHLCKLDVLTPFAHIIKRLSKTTKAFRRRTQTSFGYGVAWHDISSSLGKVQDTDQHNSILHGQKGHPAEAKTRSWLQQPRHEQSTG